MTEKPKLPKAVNFSSEQEANQFIIDKKDEGYNSRDLLKVKITVNDKNYPLNVQKINKICQNPEETTGKFTDADFARLYNRGMDPNYVVVELGCTFEEADAAYAKFLKHSNQVTVSFNDYIKLFDEVTKIDEDAMEMSDAVRIVRIAVESHLELERFKYPCYKCGKLIRITNGEWPHLKRFMIKDGGFGHYDCNKP